MLLSDRLRPENTSGTAYCGLLNPTGMAERKYRALRLTVEGGGAFCIVTAGGGGMVKD